MVCSFRGRKWWTYWKLLQREVDVSINWLVLGTYLSFRGSRPSSLSTWWHSESPWTKLIPLLLMIFPHQHWHISYGCHGVGLVLKTVLLRLHGCRSFSFIEDTGLKQMSWYSLRSSLLLLSDVSLPRPPSLRGRCRNENGEPLVSSPHVHLLCITRMVSICSRKKFLWWGVRAVLFCGHKDRDLFQNHPQWGGKLSLNCLAELKWTLLLRFEHRSCYKMENFKKVEGLREWRKHSKTRLRSGPAAIAKPWQGLRHCSSELGLREHSQVILST